MTIITNQNNEQIQYKTLTFSGGERHIQLTNNTHEVPTCLIVRAYIKNTQDLVDLFLVVNALRYKYGQSTAINVEIPYLPYARQDRICAPGQAFALEVIGKWLADLQVSKLVTWDCHSPVGIKLTGATNIEPVDIIKSDKALTALLKQDNSVLICPDKGAINRCQNIVDTLKLNDIVLCEKQRDPETGAILRTEVLTEDLTGKTAIITDDICDGGYTFIKIAERLREINADKIILFVTHGIFSKGLGVFDDLIDEIYATQSFSPQESEKLHVINYEYNFGQEGESK